MYLGLFPSESDALGPDLSETTRTTAHEERTLDLGAIVQPMFS